MNAVTTNTDDASSEAVVSVRDFQKTYKRHEAVRGVTLQLQPGEVYGLIGPDGAGKSSLMKAVAGVMTYDSGTVEVFGVTVDSERSAERIKDRLGFMPQGLGLNLYPDLSIEENVDFFARLRLVSGHELADRKETLLRMTRLDAFRSRPMKQLSGGMKQKLGLVCALIHQPELVILDEPTTGVDPVSRRDFWAILAELLREHGTTALVSTAYLDEASRFQRVAMMHEGRVLAEGDPDDVLAMVPGSMVHVAANPQVDALERLRARYEQVEAVGQQLHVFVEKHKPDEAAAEVRQVLNDLEVQQLSAMEPELEDVFVSLLRKEAVRSDRIHAVPVLQKTGKPDESGDYEPINQNGIAVEAVELVREFGDFRAVDQVSFRIRQGEIYGLLGANGAGKTTCIKMLTGIIRPTSGYGRVAGADMRYASQTIKERIGYVSQAFSLYQDLTVVENIRLYSGIYGLGRRQTRTRTDEILDLARLHGRESELAGQLPMGMRQRLALGCALVHRPQILFLDEPTSGVDPIGRRNFWELLFGLSREENVAILVTTHYMSEAEHCDRLGLMYAGRLVADATPQEMKEQVHDEAGTLLSIRCEHPLVALGLLHEGGLRSAALFGKRIHVMASDSESCERTANHVLGQSGLRVLGVSEIPLSMEDVFVYRVLALEQQAWVRSDPIHRVGGVEIGKTKQTA